MSSFCKCKSYSHFFSKNISIYAIFNDQSFYNLLTNDIVSFEQMGPGVFCLFVVVFQPKSNDICSIHHENICCGYLLEAIADLKRLT